MKIRILAAAALMLPASPALAQEEEKPFTVSGSVALVTDYRFRGVSQTDEKAAIQGGLTVTHESGLYAGTWASNLAGWGTFGGSNMELDLYGGVAIPLGSAVTLDVGLTWFMYPGGADKTDFAEPYVKLSSDVGPVSLLAGVAYAPKQEALGRWSFTGASAQAAAAGAPYDDEGDKEDNLYVWGDIAYGLPNLPITVKGHLGYSDGNNGLGPNGTAVSPTGKYLDWLLGVDYAIGPVTIGLAYVDTDISWRESAYLQPNFSSTRDGSSIASSRLVGSISASF